MPEKSTQMVLSAIDLTVAQRLRDRNFRREWFRADLEVSVPEAFKALRERRVMTQGELASAMGTKQPAISRFESSTDAVWEFQFLLRLAEAMDARLRVVVEAAEEVIAEYEDTERRQAQGASALDKFGSATPRQDLMPASVLGASEILGKKNAASEYRGLAGGFSGRNQSADWTAIRSGRAGLFGESLRVSALS